MSSLGNCPILEGLQIRKKALSSNNRMEWLGSIVGFLTMHRSVKGGAEGLKMVALDRFLSLGVVCGS